ncbi:MAG TPA: hypothetical protein VLA13_02915 [Massilibacterium sp.]|nr:hypothetical protein [Massilibacterium sp.]
MEVKGNIETIIQALQQSFQEIGRESAFVMLWYFQVSANIVQN